MTMNAVSAMRQHRLAMWVLAISIVVAAYFPTGEGYCADFPVPLSSEVVRPGAESGPTRVSVGVWLLDILQIDSAAQTLSADLAYVLSWRDPSLAHRQPGVRQYNLEDIWHPKLLVANAAAKLDPSLPEIAEVASDGTVIYRQRLIGSFTQSLDLRAFPFDHATFRIHFVMAGQRPTNIQFVPNERMVAAGMPSGAGVTQGLTLQDWRVTGSTARTSPYQLAPGFQFAGYVFEFQAERLKQHYIIKVIIPLLLIVMMSWLVFWIDQSMGSSQISVAVTSMLTLIAYRFAIGTEVPKLPYLTDLDAFILVSTMLVFLALIEVIVTTSLWYKAHQDLAKAIDRYCRFVFPVAYAVFIIAILFH